MRRAVIPLVVLAAATTVAAWSFWPRAEPNLGAGQNDARGEDARRVATVATSPAVLTLQVNDATRADVGAGEPVFFAVSLTGTSPNRAFRISTPGRAWSAELRFETADGKPVPMKIEQLGSADTYRIRRDRKTPEAAPLGQGPEALVDDSRIHLVDFGLGPEESARLSAGAYDVRVVLPLASAPEGITQLVSNTVSVRVAPAASGSQASPEQEKVRLEAAARFHLQAHNWEAAHRVALQLVERQDAGTAAFILLGDSLNGLRRDGEALAAYQDAMATLPQDLKESPDYLLARIEEVEQRLEAAKEKNE